MKLGYLPERDGQDIADEIGTSRQNVSNIIKRAMRKLFKQYRQAFPDLSDFEVCVLAMEDFGIEINTKNYNCFPPDIKNLVEESALSWATENNYKLLID